MRILVYGAGVLGSLFAVRLHDVGQDVTILARGRRLEELQTHGVVLENATTGERSVTRLSTVSQLDAGTIYDLILVTVRKDQLAGVLPHLAAYAHPTPILFMMNSATGAEQLIATLGCARVLLGFPFGAGERRDHAVRFLYLHNRFTRIPIGELDGRLTPRLREIGALFTRAGFTVSLERNMDAWLKTHVAWISPITTMLYTVSCDPARLVEASDTLMLSIRAVRESFRALRALGVPVTPGLFRVLEWIPARLLSYMMARYLAAGSLPVRMLLRHAAVARSEMDLLDHELAQLAERANLDTPALNTLRAQARRSRLDREVGANECG